MRQLLVGLAVGLLAVSGAKVAGAADSNGQPDTGINNGRQGKDRDEADLRRLRLGGQAERLGQLEKAIDYW